MAFNTKRRVALIQKALVDRAVRRMANGATLPHGFVLIDKWTALLRVTLEAGFVLAQKSEAAGFELLLNVCRRTFDREAFMHFMAIGAAHFAFEHGMVMRQSERCADFEVTLEACLRRFPWINDRPSSATSFDVQTSGPVAGLAAHVDGFFYSGALCFTAFSAARLYDFAFLSL
jgi:hypothetical protein